jgi:hypothetical protein
MEQVERARVISGGVDGRLGQRSECCGWLHRRGDDSTALGQIQHVAKLKAIGGGISGGEGASVRMGDEESPFGR